MDEKEIIQLLEDLMASWDEGLGIKHYHDEHTRSILMEQKKESTAAKTEGFTYWSPSRSMVHAEVMSRARKLLQKLKTK